MQTLRCGPRRGRASGPSTRSVLTPRTACSKPATSPCRSTSPRPSPSRRRWRWPCRRRRRARQAERRHDRPAVRPRGQPQRGPQQRRPQQRRPQRPQQRRRQRRRQPRVGMTSAMLPLPCLLARRWAQFGASQRLEPRSAACPPPPTPPPPSRPHHRRCHRRHRCRQPQRCWSPQLR